MLNESKITYTEHEKLSEVKDRSQEIGDFLEWLSGQGIVLCTWHKAQTEVYYSSSEDDANEAYRIVQPSGYYSINRSIEKLLAEYFDIDLEKLEEEKKEILQRLRNTHTS